MSKRTLNVGLIGYQFMGRAHSNAYRQAGRFFDLPYDLNLHTLCGRSEAHLQEAARVLGWQHAETDWRKVVEDPEIDLIDVSTPGNLHAEMAIAAAAAGKIVFCEKPLANSLDEARRMLEAVEHYGVPNGVFHNYRKAPAVALAKRFVDEGRIGRIHHFRATYLQDWIADPAFPMVWRLKKATAGSGAHGDINSHIIDLGRMLVGEIAEVSGLLHTFVAERPIEAGSSHTAAVDVDDAALFLARFANGAIGSFEGTRFAVGRKNFNRFEINGSRGSIAFNVERMNELEFFSLDDDGGSQGFRTISVTESAHPYAGHYWPPGHIVGYEHTFINWVADALQAIHAGQPISPGFKDGYENQRVLDAVERSHESRSWVGL